MNANKNGLLRCFHRQVISSDAWNKGCHPQIVSFSALPTLGFLAVKESNRGLFKGQSD